MRQFNKFERETKLYLNSLDVGVYFDAHWEGKNPFLLAKENLGSTFCLSINTGIDTLQASVVCVRQKRANDGGSGHGKLAFYVSLEENPGTKWKNPFDIKPDSDKRYLAVINPNGFLDLGRGANDTAKALMNAQSLSVRMALVSPFETHEERLRLIKGSESPEELLKAEMATDTFNKEKLALRAPDAVAALGEGVRDGKLHSLMVNYACSHPAFLAAALKFLDGESEPRCTKAAISKLERAKDLNLDPAAKAVDQALSEFDDLCVNELMKFDSLTPEEALDEYGKFGSVAPDTAAPVRLLLLAYKAKVITASDLVAAVAEPTARAKIMVRVLSNHTKICISNSPQANNPPNASERGAM